MSTSKRAVVVATVIERTPAEVWADVRDISSHVTWMQDAAEIRFVSDQHEGLGTKFECDTKIGPFSLTDVMEITSWEDERRMGVRHVGLVEGTGEFTLSAVGSGSTEFRWEEELVLPALLTPGAPIASFVIEWVWKRNLSRLAHGPKQRAAVAMGVDQSDHILGRQRLVPRGIRREHDDGVGVGGAIDDLQRRSRGLRRRGVQGHHR